MRQNREENHDGYTYVDATVASPAVRRAIAADSEFRLRTFDVPAHYDSEHESLATLTELGVGRHDLRTLVQNLHN